MEFAKWVFRIAGIYGLVVLTPMYFTESQISRDFPPALTHPEYYYGFIGVALAWQVVFLIISKDPIRYRMLMLPAILEKATYGIALLWLFAQQRVASLVLGFAMVDSILGVLFLIAFWKTGRLKEFKSESKTLC
jgi:hypothetical protein